MKPVLLLAAALAAGCSSQGGAPPARRDASCLVELGRGSGWHGLETVRVNAGGEVTAVRFRSEQAGTLETATLLLNQEQVAGVTKAVEECLMNLRPCYRDERIADGTQWVLWLRHGGKQKTVYFDNSFPEEIKRFADRLDATLDAAGVAKATWRPVPPGEGRKHEKELWAGIEK